MTRHKTIGALALLTALLAFTTTAGQANAAAPAWKALATVGPTHLAPYSSERQTVAITGSGTFTLSFDGDTTTPLSASGTVAERVAAIEQALNALPSISSGGGSVDVRELVVLNQSNVTSIVVTFGGSLAATDVSMLVGANASGNAAAAVSLTPSGAVSVGVTNVGGAATDGSPVKVEFDLPVGITPLAKDDCAVSGQHVECSRTLTVPSSRTLKALVAPVVVGPGAPIDSDVTVTVSGGGAPPVEQSMPIVVSSAPVEPGVQAMWAGAFDENGQPYTRAGGHPFSAGLAFRVNTTVSPVGMTVPVGTLRDVAVDPPVGFTGNPLVTARCEQFELGLCDGAEIGSVASELQSFGNQDTGQDVFDGSLNVYENTHPLSNGRPPYGHPAQFAFKVFDTRVSAFASLRPDDFGVRVTGTQISTVYKVYGAITMLQGFPADAAGKAFLTNPTECTGDPLPTLVRMAGWEAPGVFSDPASDDVPPVTDCSSVPFDPAVEITTTSAARDAATGLKFDLDVPQDGLVDPNGVATSHVNDVVVELPEGVAVNPSGATGLEGCSDAQMAPGTDSAPSCPDGSKIGAVSVTSPLVDHELGGTMYLGTPKSTDPMSGDMLRLWVVVRDDETGTMVKLPGSSTADPATGKLVATFENNPRLPFDHLEVRLRGGDKGLLATPQTCGDRGIKATLSPWSGTDPVEQSSPLDVGGDCGFGFAPGLQAGNSNNAARGTGTFSFQFSRQDGEQWIDGLTAKLPKGLLATLRGVPLCSNAQADAGVCPEGSRIGTVDGTAGSGDPFVLEQKGSAYLTEGYKGCPYGMAVKVPVVAGPFDKSSPATDLGDIVVRQAICVDRSTAEVSVISDQLPTIWHGIPLRVRSVTVSVDRPGFMLNPSNCSQKQVGGTFDSANGSSSTAASPFAASGCAALPFKPKLALRLTGRRQVRTGKHPGIRAQVNQAGVGEAGIDKAVVRLPKSLALDPNNAQALCEFADGTKPDLENHCPKGSIVGRARARTPLLNDDLVGNVYFVKNIRIDKNTGNEIRTLPMIIVALRGEVAINLTGESSTTRAGKLVNTFANVPDAPISRFNLNIRGGRNGILAVTRTRRAKINLCAGRHIAEVDNDGQNGRRHDFDVRMKTPCSKKQTRKAKRAAKKAARKARNARG